MLLRLMPQIYAFPVKQKSNMSHITVLPPIGGIEGGFLGTDGGRLSDSSHDEISHIGHEDGGEQCSFPPLNGELGEREEP